MLSLESVLDDACDLADGRGKIRMFDTLQYHAWRRLRAAYYAFGLARLPFGSALGRAVSKWETAQGFGDSPKEKSTWDAEYGDGRWDYIGQLHENSRHWAVIGYMHAFKGGGEYLDVGCGDGVLFERFKLLGYQRYVGIDISEVAIEKLRHYTDDRTYFIEADANVHEPAGHFDVIVFNESILFARPHTLARALCPVTKTGRLHHRLNVHRVAAITGIGTRRKTIVRTHR